MADPLNPKRQGELWDPRRIDAQLAELEGIKHLVVLSGGWAWHFMSPPGHREYKHQHDHKDVDLFVKPEDFETLRGILISRGFRGLGFRRLADVENLTLSRANPHLRTFIRIMVSRDGTVSAGLYDMKIRGWVKCLQWIGVVPKNLRTVDLETEFTDGRFLLTHNSPHAALMKAPPEFDVEAHPAAMTADALLEAHLVRLRRRLASEPGLQPCVVRTLDDAFASQKRQEAIKHAHRKSVGWVTKEEMERLAMPGAKGVARQVHDEIRKLDDGDRRP